MNIEVGSHRGSVIRCVLTADSWMRLQAFNSCCQSIIIVRGTWISFSGTGSRQEAFTVKAAGICSRGATESLCWLTGRWFKHPGARAVADCCLSLFSLTWVALMDRLGSGWRLEPWCCPLVWWTVGLVYSAGLFACCKMIGLWLKVCKFRHKTQTLHGFLYVNNWTFRSLETRKQN